LKSSVEIRLRINGREVHFAPQPGEMLSDLLRIRLGLTGTKIGCNEDECGICTVLVNGEPTLSCTYPAVKAAGKEILTIEGLARNNNEGVVQKDSLHPLQQAFIEQGVVQCGICIPGQIMTAYALLKNNPNPTKNDIKHALKDTLCRCAGYPSMIKAIQDAAEMMRTGEKAPKSTAISSSQPMSVIGKIHTRPDAVEKVTGRAIFTDDLKFENMLFARVKRAGIPHAILKRLDINKALGLQGVKAILTSRDIPGENNHGLVIYDWPVLVEVGERIRYAGDAVAVVAAETEEIASQAVELIDIEYEPLPIVSNPVNSYLPDAPQISSSGNLLKHIKVRKGKVKSGFAESDVVLEQTFNTSITEHAFLEPECSIARPISDGRIEIYVGSQIPYADRSQTARVLAIPEDQVRIRGQFMGGGFGGKEDIAGQIHAALLAQATGRPVKLLFDRHESLLIHPKRHATQIKVKIGATKDGVLKAVETELFGDTGGYASLGEKVMTRATTHSSGPYDVPNAKADCYAMYTNNPPAGAFRGFGVTQSAFAIESMMDMLAEEINLDPIEIRRKNILRIGSITNTGQKLGESVGLGECLDKVEQEIKRLSGDKPFASRTDPEFPYLHRAWGIAVAYKNTGLGGGAPDKANAEVELYQNGRFAVRTSSAELGQGLVTVLQMIVAEEFGVPADQVDVLVMDTDLTPDGGPTTASRQTFVTGNAALYAARTLRQAVTTSLAEKYDQPPESIRFVEGLAVVNGHSVSMGEVVSILHEEGRQPRVRYEYWAPETKPLGESGDMHFAFSFAAQASEVEVNSLTGEVKVINVIAATDVGRALNPLGLQGQVEGGVMMGLGNALIEKFIVDEGIVFTDRMARYRIPSIIHTPRIKSIVVEHPTSSGPYGAKGVGEIISIPTSPAITNAIYNAVGVRVYHLPVDQEEIVAKLNLLDN
jgi:selenium-dependent xanthine dehydrogenase